MQGPGIPCRGLDIAADQQRVRIQERPDCMRPPCGDEARRRLSAGDANKHRASSQAAAENGAEFGVIQGFSYRAALSRHFSTGLLDQAACVCLFSPGGPRAKERTKLKVNMDNRIRMQIRPSTGAAPPKGKGGAGRLYQRSARVVPHAAASWLPGSAGCVWRLSAGVPTLGESDVGGNDAALNAVVHALRARGAPERQSGETLPGCQAR